MPDQELKTPILIVGGGTGGLAAALAIARRGGACIVSEPTDWIGGQLTSQAVPADENRWVEADEGVVSITASYRLFRENLRQWYRDNRPLTAAARQNRLLNPGNGWVSRICAEPRVVHEVLQAMLDPHVQAGRVTILLHHEPAAADVDGDRVRSVTLVNTQTGQRTTVAADYFLDATETGDLYPLAKIEFATGAESHTEFGEMHAHPGRPDPQDFQAISWCFAIEHRPGKNHVIDKPARYEFWRDYIPPLDHPWPGKLFSWTIQGTEDHRPRDLVMVPWPDEPAAEALELWRYRRIVDRSLYAPDAQDAHPDICLVNWVQMDYFQRPIVGVSSDEKRRALAEARQQSMALLYWLQTEAPRHDGSGGGYPGLRLRGEVLGTADGFAKAPYVREGRRLRARTVVSEAHVGTEQRRRDRQPNQSVKPWGMAEPFADSVGIGHYRLDLHPSTGMRAGFYVQAAPFRIPMGALIPIRMKNVLAAGKGLGVTHVTNGCYRLHPIEWNVGESAGALAHHCLLTKRAPHAIQANIERVREFQKSLADDGVPLAWPWEQNAGLG